MRILQPEGWVRPRGYSNGVLAEGRVVFIAGQVGWDPEERMTAQDIVGQARQALANIVAILREGGGKPEHITRMTWFVTDAREYSAVQRELGAAYVEVIGNHYPAMTLVQVAALLEEGAKVELEATAVIP